MSGGLTRRAFLMLGPAAAGASAGLLGGCGPRRDWGKLWSVLHPEEEAALGEERWYATVCGECAAGCSTLIRVMDGRAKKVEGNPLYPVGEGGTCALGQSAVQGLYDPDRLRVPTRRVGTGAPVPLAWGQAIDELSGWLRDLRDRGQGHRAALVCPPVRGTLRWLLGRVASALDTPHLLFHEAFTTENVRAVHRQALGFTRLPHYDLGAADLIVSFGAPFLETWLSPVQFARAYGRFRSGAERRGRLVCLEPRLSLTAASADRWIPVRPGWEGKVALALTRSVVQEGAARTLPSGEAERWLRRLPAESLASVAREADVPVAWLEETARSIAAAERPVALAGGACAGTTNGWSSLRSVMALNVVCGAVGRAGGIRENPPSPLHGLDRFRESGDGTELGEPPRTFERLERLGETILDGRPEGPEVVIVWGVDLIHALPAGSKFRQALGRVPRLVVLTPQPSDTARLAHLTMPASSPLEEWADDVPDPAPGVACYGLRQPAVSALHGSRSVGDVLLELLGALGPDPAVPWKSVRELLDQNLREIHDREDGLKGRISYTEFREAAVGRGGWFPWGDELAPSVPAEGTRERPAWPLEALEAEAPVFGGDPERYPLVLLPYLSPLLGDGRGANRGWLQELGDPMTQVAWGIWVEVNPRTAAALGLKRGDRVRVESPHGSIELPVLPCPGTRPDVVAIPSGQGHEAMGRFAQGRGADPQALLGPAIAPETGTHAWVSVRVRLVATGDRATVVARGPREG